MGSVNNYYNSFYKELSKLDESGNTFSKIEHFLPKLNGDETFLDIGCGHGSVSEKLVQKGFKVTGIEINDDALDTLKQKGFKVLKKDITQQLHLNEEFDIVFLLDVLEHVFDPVFLLNEAKNNLKKDGYLIITVPLYFDIIDRFKILFTGSIISMDNLCYGNKYYHKFKSYNYDHIRFFRPSELFEMGSILDLEVDKIEYIPTTYLGKNKFLKFLVRIISNRYTVNKMPNLLAHHIKISWKKK